MTNGEKFIQTFGNVTSFYDYELDITTIHIDGDWWDAEYKEVDVLDKIISEIEKERVGYPPSADEYKTINKVLQIINRYRNEVSE